MACLHCGTANTIEAHLIPKAFVMEVKTDRGEQHLLIHQVKKKPRVSVTGLFDRNLLCGPCDGLLGCHENYTLRLLQGIRKHKAPTNTVISIDPVDGNKLVRFAAGIAWKYANTRGEFGRIDIGPYSAQLEEVAFKNEPIPSSINVALIRLIEADGDTYFYRTPIPDRQEGINMVRFTVGSFLFFLKIDKRNSGKALPTECWLRGKTSGALFIASAENYEEGRIHRELATQASTLKFFGRMKTKK